jgi:Tol biopolymer transport system component
MLSHHLLLKKSPLITSIILAWIFLTVRQSAFADVPTVPSSCSLRRITQGMGFSSLSANGKWIAGGSLSEVAGGTRVEPRYEERFQLLKISKKKKQPIAIATHTYSGRGRYPAIQLNSDGNLAVFASGGNPIGENTDNNVEIFFYNRKAKTITQLTHTIATDHFLPTISSNGKRVAFLANEYSTKDGIEARQTSLFFFDLDTQQTTQVAKTSGFFSLIWDFSLSADGTKLALATNIDPLGSNPDGTFEIFLWDAATQTFTQITNTLRSETNSGNSSSPIMNADGTRVGFNSVADLTGENPNGNRELFLFDSRTKTLTQLTHTIGESALYEASAISADGRIVIFEGDENFLAGNIDNVRDANDSEVFLLNTDTRAITQLTSSGGTSFSPAISANGKSIAFISARRYFVELGSIDSFTPPPDPDAGVYLATCP